MIAAILEADTSAPPKRRHTALGIFEWLRDGHGYTIVKEYADRRDNARCGACLLCCLIVSLPGDCEEPENFSLVIS
jgi:hypothetical protein